jgi:hypothetical protein
MSDIYFALTWPVSNQNALLGFEYSPHTELEFYDHRTGESSRDIRAIISIGLLIFRIDIVL